MKLTSDQVKHVAKLASLPISDEEEQKYSEQLSEILDYIEQLNRVDTSTAEPLFNVTLLSNVMRVDGALQNSPNKKGGFFSDQRK